MLTRCFKLTSPMRFEISIEDVDNTRLIATPEFVAISDDDIYAYQGRNDYGHAVAKAMPVCLLRASTGRIVRSPDNTTGGSVILIPGGNGCEGFSRELINLDSCGILPIPDGGGGAEWVFADAVASACSAIRKAGTGVAAVFGSDMQAYVLARTIAQLNGTAPLVICEDETRMDDFSFAKAVSLREDELGGVDTAFIAMDNAYLPQAVNSALDMLMPGGTLMLCGWQDNGCVFDTSHMVNKELHAMGSSTNTIEDYQQASRLMAESEYAEGVSRLALGVESISSIREYYHAFEAEAHSKRMGKIIYKLAF